MVDFAQFGTPGVPGPPGSPGPLGGTPDENGVVSLDHEVRTILGPHTRETALAVETPTAGGYMVAQLRIGLTGDLRMSRKVTFEAMLRFDDDAGTKVQTIDGNRVVSVDAVSGEPTLATDGDDHVYDPDTLGHELELTVYDAGGGEWFLDFAVSIVSGSGIIVLGVRELF